MAEKWVEEKEEKNWFLIFETFLFQLSDVGDFVQEDELVAEIETDKVGKIINF